MDLYAGYDDGLYNNVTAIKALFPTKTVIAITVKATDNFGDCLDVETGDATPQQAPDWVKARRQAGHGGPLVYCSEALWPTVRQCFSNAGVIAPGYWIAAYPGIGPVLYPGSIGHQFVDHGAWDESVMADYLVGIDRHQEAPEVELVGQLVERLRLELGGILWRRTNQIQLEVLDQPGAGFVGIHGLILEKFRLSGIGRCLGLLCLRRLL